MAQHNTLAWSLETLTPNIGARVEGLDLAGPLDAADLAALEAALVERQVLFFEGQTLSPEQQRDLARRFGALHVHPIYPHAPGVPEIIVLDTHPGNPPDNDNWHTDVTFIQTPPLGALLYAERLPPFGGDTVWASTAAAYDALSAPLRALLDGLEAEHDFVKSFPKERWGADEAEARWAEARRKHPPVVHPVVRVHPVSGRRGLFVNQGFTTRLLGVSQAESDALLPFLLAHVARPEFTVRWRWKVGDVAFWDNRLTQHYALADYLPHRRVMRRATILGDRPRGPSVGFHGAPL